jgi:hypothetical protein
LFLASVNQRKSPISVEQPPTETIQWTTLLRLN